MSTKAKEKGKSAAKQAKAAKPAEKAKRQRPRKRDPARANLSRLSIPMDEQDRMVATVHSSADRAVREYLKCLMMPKYTEAKVPDAWARPTSTCTSKVTYNIPIKLNAADPDSGRFSIAIQPQLGAITSPQAYKVAISEVAGLWTDNDWSDTGSYVFTIEGSDPRLDPYFTTLTQPPLGVYSLENFTNLTPAPFIVGSTQPYENANTAFVHYNTPGVQLISNGASGRNRFKLAKGQYAVTMSASTTDTFSADISFSVVASTCYIDALTFARSPDNKMARWVGFMTVPAGATIQLHADLTTSGQAYTNANISFIPTFYSPETVAGTGGVGFNANSLPSGNSGIVQEIRTVAMSALATYVGPTLTNGGNIASAYVPGYGSIGAFFTSAPLAQFGSLQNWENLARLPESYNGPIENGTYVWWSPEDMNDLGFETPDAIAQLNVNDREPSLIISGQYSPGAVTGTSTASVIRLEVVTVYEFVTMSGLWKPLTNVGSQAQIDMVNRALAGQPHAMANAEHMSWFKDFWGGLKQGLGYVLPPAKLLWDNKDKILPFL